MATAGVVAISFSPILIRSAGEATDLTIAFFRASWAPPMSRMVVNPMASISIPDKIESLAVSADGTVYLATDNDGVDENYGETVFIDLGSLLSAIRFSEYNSHLRVNASK